MKRIIFLYLILYVFRISYCMDTTSTKYFPLKEGNFWVYNYSRYNPNLNFRVRDSVGIPMTFDGHVYFPYHYYRWWYWHTDYLRVDSITGNIVEYNTSGCGWLNNEELVDSLRARLNDSSKSYHCGTPFVRCNDTSFGTYFSQTLPTKQFFLDLYEELDRKQYAKTMGMVSRSSVGMSGEYFTLVGCRIDGVVYGDTSLITSIKPIAASIPANFSLSQNYPNPFNPTTKIKFDIQLSPLSERSTTRLVEGVGGFITLRIFDLLGREVATLVNEQLQPGTYEVEFDGTNFPSGVYFFKLITDSFTESRRMVLIK